ncbi:Alpha-factor-transporting ATPase [Escovopsis weberi]|uniref:Alpha-factor-transporting ATPase n=1 Tax=Escovopsis weberi TaxID=150374 RepID=A0A0M9VXT3_ESCWE|nr:Alpha-factor-transporting ATPase [Escovopsis weberi]
MKRILRQPKSWFDMEENSASRISDRLERNSEEMRNIVGRFIPNVTFAISVLMVSTIWALVVSWKLTLVALAPLPVVVAALKAYSTMSKKWETKCNKGAEETSACLNEIFVNIRVVRALTLENHFRKKYDALVSRTMILGYKRASYTCGLYGFYESMTYPVMALVFFYAATLLAKDSELTTTKVLQVVNLLLFSIGNATELLSGLPQLTMAQATAKQLLEYAELDSDASSPASDILPRYQIDTPLPIEVRDLTFAYSQNPKEQVLHGISFSIRPRSCTAIVGRSGCGKSTIISLLMGLYAPSCPHQLAFSNVSHSHLDTQHLRSRMAYVSQTPFLFPASVADNIFYGLPDDSPLRGIAHIHRAAQAVGLHDFIVSLPLGYATPIGDGGLSLSGGQAQRLSIARALVRQPQLLVMDEPTSALDAASSAALCDNIAAIARRCRAGESDMAIVVVTHSRDMMQVAGNILMVEGGVVVQEGSYESLMQAGGPFRHLVKGGQS